MHRTVVFIAALFVVLSGAAVASSPEVTGMKAFLFYGESGAFSENIIDNGEFALFNTVIGEGSAKEPSSQTLVVVEIGGECVSGACKIEFTASGVSNKKKRNLLKKTTEVFCETGKCNAAFMLYDTGCVPIELKARIAGSRKFVRKKLDFVCGE